MTERELFAAVCAAPDDDAPRLAYADFIERSEPDYAEFIRLQVARAAEERARKAPRGNMGPREQELWLKHYAEWGRYIQKYVRDSRVPHRYDQGWGFERGFIAFVRMEPENFIALGERLFRMAPVQHADLYDGSEPVRPLFASPLLAKLDSLSLWRTKLDDDDAIAIAQCQPLSRATWLDLRDNNISERGVRALAESPYMQNKVVLDLRGNPCDPGEEASYDSQGTVADAGLPEVARRIERELGRRVPWFRTVFKLTPPDRYHAKWVGLPPY
jgi:uncharacterized protein (TIGR02996 family)